MEEKKLSIRFPSDVAELFMAIYSIRNAKDDYISFEVNFRDYLDEIISDYYKNSENPEECEKSFYVYFSKAKSKKYFADALKYDFEENKIITEVDIEMALSIVDKYDTESISLIGDIVKEFEKYHNNEEIDEAKRKNIKLELSKTMTECGNSNSD